MKLGNACFVVLLGLGFASCRQPESDTQRAVQPTDSVALLFPEERHLKNARQLTFEGDNAEAYWSFDNSKLVFQRTDHRQIRCDQIFVGAVRPLLQGDTSRFRYRMVSTGKGRTTCAFFLPGDTLLLYSSTHLEADTCPAVPDREKIGKYVWPIYNSYEIFVADLNGHIVRQLTRNSYYDAEATVSPRGDRIVFTSNRDGDLELYSMKLDGSDVRRLTHALGYDGGAWFSPDGSMIVWRASRPKKMEEKNSYRRLLKQGLVAPTQMEIWVAHADGSNARQVTHLGGANWAPVFTPDGKKILFSSNHRYKRGFPFDLFLIDLNGNNLEQVTFSGSFDSFPMFSYDGKYLVWCSNRHSADARSTNIFIAEWVP
ncbi:MAG: hypothetical protein NZL95_04765 [Chitinophagales bacterium]|nr:hypothetical protein [Chitinophagales bacterium]MDW8427845.1 hypothetical protein [Chitinophagales bacterium]